MLGRVALTVPASESAAAVADAVAAGFAREAGLSDAAAARLVDIVRRLVEFSVQTSYEGRGGGDIELQLELDPHGVAAIRTYFDRFWEQALLAFKDAVERDNVEETTP